MNVVIGGLLVLLLSGTGLYFYLANEIDQYKQEIKNKTIAIEAMANNIVEQDMKYKDALKRMEFKAKFKEKKNKIEKELKYDNSKTLPVSSTIIQLP